MKIDHIAIWCTDLEKQRDFYCRYFNGKTSERYTNVKKQFQSYFVEFEAGARLELMQMAGIPENMNDCRNQFIGFIHLAISVGSQEAVDRMTEELRYDGYEVVSEPRFTGDGYYESCILDPEKNRIEIIG